MKLVPLPNSYVYKRQAQQGVGNRLDTDTFLPIVQSDTVSVDVVTALMHQPPRSAVLAVIHDGDRFSLDVYKRQFQNTVIDTGVSQIRRVFQLGQF